MDQKEVDKSAEYNITTLRTHLFETMNLLSKGNIEPDRAKAMSSCAQVILNAIKVELQFRELTNRLDKLPEQLME